MPTYTIDYRRTEYRRLIVDADSPADALDALDTGHGTLDDYRLDSADDAVVTAVDVQTATGDTTLWSAFDTPDTLPDPTTAVIIADLLAERGLTDTDPVGA